MRLRLAPVEYKVCAATDCETKYEGAQCPQCRQAFDPTLVRKELADRLILVDVDPPFYEQAQRYRCTVCKGIFALREEDVVRRAQCDQCRQPLFSRESLLKLWRDAETLLQRARKLDRARRQLVACVHCSFPLPAVRWCPLSLTLSHAADESALPQNPLVAWVRTFQMRESVEELQIREWNEDDGDNVWSSQGTELENENTEGEGDVYAE